MRKGIPMIMRLSNIFWGYLSVKGYIFKKVKLLSELVKKQLMSTFFGTNQKRTQLALGGFSPVQYRLMNQSMVRKQQKT